MRYLKFIVCLIVGHEVKRTRGQNRKRTWWHWECQRCGYSYASARRGGLSDSPPETEVFRQRIFPSAGFYGKKWFA